MQSIGIIGFGRFGQTLARLLQNNYAITVFDPIIHESTLPVKFATLQDVLQQKILFIAVPINQFDSVITTIANKLAPQTTIIDVCSVKVYPTKIMLEKLPSHVDIIATHPLFGPDSFNDLTKTKIMMHSVRDHYQRYKSWKQFFKQCGLTILEMTPDEHDRLAAVSQGVTHFIGRLLEEAHIESTSINTLGFNHLLKIKQQTCQDSWELFCDLQRYNPYSQTTIEEFLAATLRVKEKLFG